MNKLRGLLLAAGLLVGCGADGPLYKPVDLAPDGDAVLYLYRPWAFAGGAATTHLRFDDKKDYAIANGEYIAVRLAPGPHKVQKVNKGFQSWGAPEPVISFTADRGAIYYIRKSGETKFTPGGPALWTVLKFEQVDAATALGEIKECHLAETSE